MASQVAYPGAARPQPAPAASRGWSAGSVVALALGSVMALTSLGLLSGGGVLLWSDQTQREDGFVTSPVLDLSTDAHAIVTENIEIHAEGPDWVLPESIFGDARVRVTGSGETFVGVGPTAEVRRYLTGVSYSFAPDLRTYDGLHLAATAGEAPASPPGSQDFWIATSEGSGERSITWPVSNGDWTLVVMNSDAGPGLRFEGDVGAEAPALRPVAVGMLIAGGILLIISIALIAGAANRARARRTSTL